MTTELSAKIKVAKEQRFRLPGYHTWHQFKAIQAAMENVPGVRIAYLDGKVKLMTVGEEHERIKSIIGFLLELYFCEQEIEFIPVGSATREDETRSASFEPDESYYIATQKLHPDLAIEVVITSGGTEKLEKYKRFKITEVWFWENRQITIYHFRPNRNEYDRSDRSQLLPDLNIDLLVRCVLMPSRLQAQQEFIKAIR